jgi:hypothetical protein
VSFGARPSSGSCHEQIEEDEKAVRHSRRVPLFVVSVVHKSRSFALKKARLCVLPFRCLRSSLIA